MDGIVRTLRDATTYRRLGYLLLGMPLGLIWFVALITGWSLCLGFLVTPLVVPMLVVMAFLTRGAAAVESELARLLLGVDVRSPSLSLPPGGFRERLRLLFGSEFWRAQAYLWLRWFLGFPVGVVFVSLLSGAVAMIFAPLWVPFVHGGAHLGFWRPHTFVQSLALIPPGLILLPVTLLLASPMGAAFSVVVSGLLPGSGVPEQLASGSAGREVTGASARLSRRGLTEHAVADALVVGTLIVIWGLTSQGGYFWPIWVVLPLATALAMHAWFVALAERPELLRWFRGSSALAGNVGVGTAFWLFTVGVWAASGHGNFWPIWTLLALGLVVGPHALLVMLNGPNNAEMTERIRTLETSRAGAVDVQDSELRRIERDLHDGAQARLVALGMSLGMAEQKLAEDPARAGELLADARVGAEHALRELRELARGIHPPVLADRGLGAALTALTNSTPLHVALSIDIPQRPPSAVESAAYFVSAEALANAAKHAQADWLEIRIARIGNRLEIEISDDGVGGADPNGSGLVGLRRRVEALDGTLRVSSPRGGPTTLYAELPCV